MSAMAAPDWLRGVVLPEPERGPRGERVVSYEAVAQAVAMADAAMKAKTRAAQRSALAAASLGFQKGVAASQAAMAQQVEEDMMAMKSRITELEVENDRLSGGGSTIDASSAFGSPLKANRPAAEVVAAAAAAASRGGRHARGALGARLDAALPAAAVAALPPPPLPPPPPPPAAAAGARRLGTADIWAMGRQRLEASAPSFGAGGAERLAAAHEAADDPPGLREDFLVAGHRLRWAQRALDAAILREAFGAWRRGTQERAKRLRGAQLLLHRVLRRDKAHALAAWREAMLAGPDEGEEDAAATSPEVLRKLLRRAPPAIARAFDAQAALFASALAAAEEARGELARAHAAELAALRRDISSQSSSLQNALASASRLQPGTVQQQLQYSGGDAAWRPPLPPAANDVAKRRRGVPPLSLPLPPMMPRPVVPRPPPPPPPPPSLQRERHREPQPPPPAPAQIRLPPLPSPPQAGFSRAAALLSHAAAPQPPSPPASEAPSSAPPSPLPPQHLPSSLNFAPAALPSRPSSAASGVAPPAAASSRPVASGTGLVQVATLVIRGWTRGDAVEALTACSGRVDAAAEWLVARGRMPQAAEARPGAGVLGGKASASPRTPSHQL